jgi:EpsI family protein
MLPRNYPAMALGALFAFQGAAFYGLSRRVDAVPAATPLSAIPARVGAWGMVREGAVDADEKAVLRADDYLTRDYATPSGREASLFIAYFRSQRAGQAPHSPKNCLPGAGWTWSVADTIRVAVSGRAQPIKINRYVVGKGDEHAVVLYWYQSHSRVVAEETRAALFTAWDALRWNRTDTSLVRVVAPNVQDGVDFVQAFFPELRRYNQVD